MYCNHSFHRTSHPYPRPRARRGSLIIECVIAAMLITVASVGLLRLTQTASQLNRQADDRLAAVLIAENVALSLQQIPFDQLATDSQAAAHQIAKETKSDITITSQPFTPNKADAANTPGLHIAIVVRTGTAATAVRHVWRFPPPSSKELLADSIESPGADIEQAQQIPTLSGLAARRSSPRSSRALDGERR